MGNRFLNLECDRIWIWGAIPAVAIGTAQRLRVAAPESVFGLGERRDVYPSHGIGTSEEFLRHRQRADDFAIFFFSRRKDSAHAACCAVDLDRGSGRKMERSSQLAAEQHIGGVVLWPLSLYTPPRMSLVDSRCYRLGTVGDLLLKVCADKLHRLSRSALGWLQ